MDDRELLMLFAREHIRPRMYYSWKIQDDRTENEVRLILKYSDKIDSEMVILPSKVAEAAVRRYEHRNLVGISFGE